MKKKVNRGLKTYLRKYWTDQGVLSDFNSDIFNEDMYMLRAVMVNGELFLVNDYGVLMEDTFHSRSTEWNWKGRILNFFIDEFYDSVQMFVEVRWLYNTTINGELCIDPISGMQLVKPQEKSHSCDNFRPVCHLPVRLQLLLDYQEDK